MRYAEDVRRLVAPDVGGDSGGGRGRGLAGGCVDGEERKRGSDVGFSVRAESVVIRGPGNG